MSGRASAPAGAVWLAFDTSGSEGSVAVGRIGGRTGVGEVEVLTRVVIEHRLEQAARLVPAIDQALSAAGVERTGLSDHFDISVQGKAEVVLDGLDGLIELDR